tara:strand:+ start:784 stop:1188 length:405 start_codon:yes stop_codon:yes gene_type:complete
MELEGEVSICIDEILNVSMELDTERLAEELAIEHNFVDDEVMREFFYSHIEDSVQDEIAGVSLEVSDNTDAIDDLRVQVEGLEPDNNYVRINDLRTIICEEIAAALSAAINHTNRGRMSMSEWAREEKGMIDGR